MTQAVLIPSLSTPTDMATRIWDTISAYSVAGFVSAIFDGKYDAGHWYTATRNVYWQWVASNDNRSVLFSEDAFCLVTDRVGAIFLRRRTSMPILSAPLEYTRFFHE